MKVAGKMTVAGASIQEGGLLPMSSFPALVPLGTVVNVSGILYKCTNNVGGKSVYENLDARPVKYEHTQNVNSTTWTIVHNLNTLTPIIQCFNGTSLLAYSSAFVTNANTVTVTFSRKNTGTALVVAV